MDRFAATGFQTAVEASPGETIINLFNSPAAPTARLGIYYIALSAGGTMADVVARYIIQRTTAVGTEASGVVPENLDNGAVQGGADAGQDHSAEPTYTAATEFWENDVHLRALAQIQLQPDGHIIIPGTQNNGVGIQVYSASYVGNAQATVHFVE